MINRIAKLAIMICSLVLASMPFSTMAEDVLGKKPHHVFGGASSVVNNQAITKMIWAPGIDDGYVPQGLTVAEGSVLLSGYKSTDPKVARGPCRVFKLTHKRANTPVTSICRRIVDMPAVLFTLERAVWFFPIRGSFIRWI